MINANEILNNLGSIVVVKNKDEIVYTNSKIDLSNMQKTRITSKKIIAEDGMEYEIITYPPFDLKHLDALTGLYSKGTFQNEAKKYFDYSNTNSEEFCVVFMDLDNFKKINDTYGHLNADKILKLVADIIKRSVRGTDLCGRFGGDEFVILLKGANENITLAIMEEINKRIRTINEEFKKLPEQISIGASFGIASSHDLSEANDIEDIVREADVALYKAKQNKGSIEIFHDDKQI